MAKTKIEIELDIPDGYEYAGEYRRIARGELYLDNERKASIWECSSCTASHYALLRRSPAWRPLTPEKAFEFMLSATPVTMRHKSWGLKAEGVVQRIRKLYYNTLTCSEMSTDLDGIQSHICNMDYLEPDA
jgi:hypothetical protein